MPGLLWPIFNVNIFEDNFPFIVVREKVMFSVGGRFLSAVVANLVN